MTHRDALITKNYTLAVEKSMFKIENFSLEIEVKKNFFKIGKWNYPKIKNMTQRDALNTKNYTLAHQKIDF